MCNFKKRRLTLALLCYTVATFERAAGGACEQQRAGRMAVFNDRRGHKNAQHSSVEPERQPQAAGPLSTGFTVWDAGPLEVSQVLHLSLDSTHNFGSEILYFSLWGGAEVRGVFLNFFGHQSQSAFCPVEAV